MSEREDKKELLVSIVSSLKLDSVGERAFIELCAKGCNPEVIEACLHLLFTQVRIKAKSIITLSDGNKYETESESSLRPLDSIAEALGEFDKKDLDRLKNNLLKLASQIDSLNNTNLVQSVEVDELGHEANLLPQRIRDYAERVIPVLRRKADEVGEKLKPQFNEYLKQLIEHVQASTGNPNYRLICNLLESFNLYLDEDALKQRAYRQRGGSKKKGNAK